MATSDAGASCRQLASRFTEPSQPGVAAGDIRPKITFLAVV
jgi:hypothetical protein